MKKINHYYSQLLSNTWANLALKTIIWGLLTGLLMLIIRGILFIYADELKTPLTKPPEMLPYPEISPLQLVCANLLIILIGAIFFWRLYQKNRP